MWLWSRCDACHWKTKLKIGVSGNNVSFSHLPCDNNITSSPPTLWQLYNVLYTEICGFKPFSWQKSRIFFVAMTWHPRGDYVLQKVFHYSWKISLFVKNSRMSVIIRKIYRCNEYAYPPSPWTIHRTLFRIAGFLRFFRDRG